MFLQKFSGLLPPRNYIIFHYTYFFLTIIVSSVIFWLSSRPGDSIEYIDSLFMVTSAMTETGLATVNLSQINTFQQILLILLMIGGNTIFVSYFVVLIRKRAFESKFSELGVVYNTEKEKNCATGISLQMLSGASSLSERQHGNSNHSTYKSIGLLWTPPYPDNSPSKAENQSSVVDTLQHSGTNDTTSHTILGLGNLDNVLRNNLKDSGKEDYLGKTRGLVVGRIVEGRKIIPVASHSSHSMETIIPCLTPKVEESLSIKIDEDQLNQNICFQKRHDERSIEVGHNPYMINDSAPHIDRPLPKAFHKDKSRFYYKNGIQLGGAEYGAIKLLTYLIPIYFIILQLLGCLSSALYIASCCREVANSNAINPWWLGIFLGVSAFTNCGLSLLDLGMAPFGKDIYLLATLSLLILCGNVAYPIVLRSSMWLLWYITSKLKGAQSYSETLQFILDYPRRVYTNVFPAAHTWWLLFALVILTGIDWISFYELNLADQAIISIPNSFRQAQMFFQSISIRSAGFSLVPVGMVAIGTQVISIVMMYISAYPVLIPLRSSNIYEEQSLGIYKGDLEKKDTPDKETEVAAKGILHRPGLKTKVFFLRQQLQHQLAHDMWWLAISIVFIVCFEADHYGTDPITYSVFNMIFEVISAYGPVGLSTGLPNQTYSLSGGFHTISKVLLCAVMIRGRHRGLPIAIDKAISLPSEIQDGRDRRLQNESTSV